MPVETASFIHQLDPANPSGADRLASGDDHIRMLKAALKATFPNITGPVNLTHGFLNGLANAALPPGIIMLFSGATAPLGWAVCDGGTYPKADGTGSIVVPDLRGRVAVGANTSNPLGTQFGQTTKTVSTEAGGGHSHTGATSTAGAHTHSVGLTGTTGPAEGPLNLGDAGFGASYSPASHTHSVEVSGPTGSAGDHSHALNIDQVSGHAHQVSVDVTQPSLALNYIIKL